MNLCRFFCFFFFSSLVYFFLFLLRLLFQPVSIIYQELDNKALTNHYIHQGGAVFHFFSCLAQDEIKMIYFSRLGCCLFPLPNYGRAQQAKYDCRTKICGQLILFVY